MIVRTEAIVLRRMDYGETSQIVTLFTREKGRLAVMAKGARLPKSRFGSSLQPMSYMQAVLYYKASRGLQTLTESAHVRHFARIGSNLKKLSVGQRVMELTYALLHEEEANPLVFNLLVETLYQLNDAEARATNLLLCFQLRLASALGFAPAIDRASIEALTDDGGRLALERGAVLPLLSDAHQGGLRASRTALRAFAILARADLDTVMRMRIARETYAEVDTLVEAYLRYHVQDAYPGRGSRVTDQLLGAS
ncbi:MAG: DNA repair protein RecO [Rhodothermales bacterium]